MPCRLVHSRPMEAPSAGTQVWKSSMYRVSSGLDGAKGRQIAHPEVRREAADVLAHLEDALFDAEAGFLLVDPVDPAHLLRNTEQFSFSGKVLFQVSVHAHGHFGQRGICRQRQLPLEGGHAVVESVRHTQRVAGVCRVAVEHLVLVQIRPHRLTEQGREGTEGLDTAAEGGVHKPRLFQPDAAAGGVSSKVCTTGRCISLAT